MALVTVDQLNPGSGDVTDGRRVRLADGTIASIVQLAAGFLIVRDGSELGPFNSPWAVLDALTRIDSNASHPASITDVEPCHAEG